MSDSPATPPRTTAKTDGRKTATDLHEVGSLATNSSLTKMTKEDVGILRLVQQGAAWDKQLNIKTGVTEHIVCEFCGATQADITHMIWYCPALSEERKS